MKKLPFLVGIIILLAILAASWWKISISSVNPQDKTTQQFVISPGDSVRDVARKLKESNLIRDQIAFFLLIKKLNIGTNIQAGKFILSPSMSAYDIATALTHGTEDTLITIPEGWRSEEILEYLQKNGIDSQNWTVTSELSRWKSDEGKHFPDTYRVPRSASVSAIRDLLRTTFSQKAPPLSQEDLIIASLIEREAQKAVDRPLVASVIKNRLQIGMKLDIDATIQYILGKPGNWWPKEILFDDLKIKSPYNTYINSGLPPTPIANPGLASINAALNPTQTDYLYYLTDKEGNMHYAQTLDEHNTNVARFIQ